MGNHYDELLLKKLRGLYQSCLKEDDLDTIGDAPLQDMVQKIRELFRGKTTVVDAQKTDVEKERERLTATVAYLHSRGECYSNSWLAATDPPSGIDALFDYSIDGDAGRDPNFMTLWLSQGDLGLPSKVLWSQLSDYTLFIHTSS